MMQKLELGINYRSKAVIETLAASQNVVEGLTNRITGKIEGRRGPSSRSRLSSLGKSSQPEGLDIVIVELGTQAGIHVTATFRNGADVIGWVQHCVARIEDWIQRHWDDEENEDEVDAPHLVTLAISEIPDPIKCCVVGCPDPQTAGDFIVIDINGWKSFELPACTHHGRGGDWAHRIRLAGLVLA